MRPSAPLPPLPPAKRPAHPGRARDRARDWLLGGALLLALLATVDWLIGWPRLLAPWRLLDWPTLLGLLSLTAISYLARAARVQRLLGEVTAGHFPVTLRLSVWHTTGNVLLPMRLGELLFPWLMRRYFGQDWLTAGWSLLWLRLMDLHCIVLAGTLALWWRAPTPWWLAFTALWLGLPALWAFRWHARPLTVPQVAHASWHARFVQLIASLVARAPRDGRELAVLYGWTALCWASKFLAFALLLGHFLPVPAWRLLLAVIGAELSSVLPVHGIAGAGSYELAAVAALMPFGVPFAEALAAAVNLHLFMLGATLTFGLLALLAPGWPRPCSVSRS